MVGVAAACSFLVALPVLAWLVMLPLARASLSFLCLPVLAWLVVLPLARAAHMNILCATSRLAHLFSGDALALPSLACSSVDRSRFEFMRCTRDQEDSVLKG